MSNATAPRHLTQAQLDIIADPAGEMLAFAMDKLAAAMHKAPDRPVLLTDAIADGFDDLDDLPHVDGFASDALEYFRDNLRVEIPADVSDPQDQGDVEIIDGNTCVIRVNDASTRENMGLPSCYAVAVGVHSLPIEFVGPIKAQDKTGAAITVVIASIGIE